jgi:FtsP/CotA-like multicopper oxidase with cupredoxin domain
MNRMDRRNFLGLTAGLATGILLARCDRNSSQTRPASALALPTVHSSQGGLLDLDLEASYRAVSLGNRTAYLLTYNGQVPGPRLEAKPGDTVKLRFTNRLSQPTNLHYHGLHIPPTETGDNVFRKVAPGETVAYEFTLSRDHRAGTFWYHPHVHGLVAEQVFGGLAGLFIVRGELDEIPEIQAAQEEFLVLKDFALDADGYILPPGHVAQMTGRVGGLLTATGQVNPTLALPARGLLRLRLLNASASRFLRLSLEDHPLYLIATDGGAIQAPLELSELFLAPGERAEILVKGDREPGDYRLLNHPYNPAQGMMGGGMMGGGRMGRGGMGGNRMGSPDQTTRTETVATLTYQTVGPEIPLPPQLIPVDPLPEPQTTRRFELNHGMGGGMVFLINGRAFDHQRVDTQVKLGTVEDWEITNTGTMAHPFHVHVNKFQVIARNGQSVTPLAWKDVVTVAPGEQVRIRMPFRDYTGKTVYHCHVLDHEDRGMMGILEIQA